MSCYGQIITFDFIGLTGSEATATSNFNDANLSSSTISRGAGLIASNNGNRFNANNWALNDIATAISGNDYMEFTITPNATYKFDVTTINVNFQRSSTGVRGILLRSSLDGYTSDIDTEKVIADALSIDDSILDANEVIITELSEKEVQIKVGANHTISNVKILDVLGRIIYSFNGNSSIEVYDISKLSKAAYIAKVTLTSGQTISKKAIKRL